MEKAIGKVVSLDKNLCQLCQKEEIKDVQDLSYPVLDYSGVKGREK
jgi:hypothetical protein